MLALHYIKCRYCDITTEIEQEKVTLKIGHLKLRKCQIN